MESNPEPEAVTGAQDQSIQGQLLAQLASLTESVTSLSGELKELKTEQSRVSLRVNDTAEALEGQAQEAKEVLQRQASEIKALQLAVSESEASGSDLSDAASQVSATSSVRRVRVAGVKTVKTEPGTAGTPKGKKVTGKIKSVRKKSSAAANAAARIAAGQGAAIATEAPVTEAAADDGPDAGAGAGVTAEEQIARDAERAAARKKNRQKRKKRAAKKKREKRSKAESSGSDSSPGGSSSGAEREDEWGVDAGVPYFVQEGNTRPLRLSQCRKPFETLRTPEFKTIFGAQEWEDIGTGAKAELEVTYLVEARLHDIEVAIHLGASIEQILPTLSATRQHLQERVDGCLDVVEADGDAQQIRIARVMQDIVRTKHQRRSHRSSAHAALWKEADKALARSTSKKIANMQHFQRFGEPAWTGGGAGGWQKPAPGGKPSGGGQPWKPPLTAAQMAAGAAARAKGQKGRAAKKAGRSG